MTLLRRARGTLEWRGASVDFEASTPVSAGYEVLIEDAPPDDTERYLYRLRVQDPQGRIAESNIVEEGP
jgi:hypothetical protein